MDGALVSSSRVAPFQPPNSTVRWRWLPSAMPNEIRGGTPAAAGTCHGLPPCITGTLCTLSNTRQAFSGGAGEATADAEGRFAIDLCIGRACCVWAIRPAGSEPGRLVAAPSIVATGGRRLATGFERLADALARVGRNADAISAAIRCETRRTWLAEHEPSNSAWARGLLSARLRVALLADLAGNRALAAERLEAAKGVLKLLPEDGAERLIHTFELARATSEQSYRKRDYRATLQACDAALAVGEQLRSRGLLDARRAGELGKVRIGRGVAWAEMGTMDQATRDLQAAVEYFEVLIREYPDLPILRIDLAVALSNLARAHADGENLDASRDAHTKRLALAEQQLAKAPASAEWSKIAAESLRELVRLAERQGQRAEASRLRERRRELGR